MGVSYGIRPRQTTPQAHREGGARVQEALRTKIVELEAPSFWESLLRRLRADWAWTRFHHQIRMGKLRKILRGDWR